MSELVDLPIRTVYRVAHLGLRTWWLVRRPHTHGALVAVWNEGELLLIRSSYRKAHSLPGGYVKRGEDARLAAARELREETSLDVVPSRLTHTWHGARPFESRTDELDIFELEVDARPIVPVNNREIVWAGWRSAAQAREMNVVPHLREYLDASGR